MGHLAELEQLARLNSLNAQLKIATDGSSFLHVTRQTSEDPLTLKYLPNFHVIATEEDIKLLTFNGQEIATTKCFDENEEFLKKLNTIFLCKGTTTDSESNWRERYGDKTIVRSNGCRYVAETDQQQCLNCAIEGVNSHANPYHCDQCGLKSNSLLKLKHHFKKEGHQSDIRPRCFICSKKFKRMCHLRQHLIAVHFNIKPYHCQLCDFQASAPFSVTNHAKLTHKSRGYQVVESEMQKLERFEAKFNFTSVQQLNKHRSSDAECPACFKRFNSQAKYDLHLKKHPDLEATVNCPTCSEIVSKKALNQHCYKKHDAAQAVCTECLKSVDKRRIASHHSKFHKLRSKPLCAQCGKLFSSTYLMKVHLETVHGSGQKSFGCKHCGKVFNHLDRVQTHVRKMHNVRHPFPCKICLKVFRERGHLQSHYWSIHLLAKPYKCKHCRYRSSQSSKIYIHCKDKHGFTKMGTKDDIEIVESEMQRIKDFEKKFPPISAKNS